MIVVADARALGNLPAEITDAVLAPHIDSGIRRVRQQLGATWVAADADQEALAKEAAACFSLAAALPVLHTFYLDERSRVPKMSQDTDMVFTGPDEVRAMAREWEARAWRALHALERPRVKAVVV